jgi:Lipocalin-like domain
MRQYLIAVAILVITAAAHMAATSQRIGALRVVPAVDYQRYAGTWFEIARLPNRFQRACAGDVTATYAVRQVRDTCREPSCHDHNRSSLGPCEPVGGRRRNRPAGADPGHAFQRIRHDEGAWPRRRTCDCANDRRSAWRHNRGPQQSRRRRNVHRHPVLQRLTPLILVPIKRNLLA